MILNDVDVDVSVHRKGSERFVGRLVVGRFIVALMLGGSFWIVNGYEAEGWNSPSIGSRISTFWWMAGQRTGSHTGSTHFGMMDLDDSVDVPTMQGEV